MIISDDQNLKCHGIIHTASSAAAAAAAGMAQIPLSDAAVIVPIQITMIVSLGSVLDIELTKSAATSLLGTITTSAIGRGISQVFLGWIPGLGNALNACTAAAITEAAGWAVVKYFDSLSDEELRKYRAAKQDGRQEAKAEFEQKMRDIRQQFKNAAKNVKEFEQLEFLFVGAFALGIVAAKISGKISKEKAELLEQAIVGVGYNALPERIKNKISELFYNCESITFNDAMEIIKKVDYTHWHIFDDVIDIILESDDSNKEKKEAFKMAWKKNYEAA
jgi:uncharacterized protein (DUF697 family)